MSGPFLFLIQLNPRLQSFGLFAITLIAMIGASRLKFNDVPKDLFGSSHPDFEILAQVEKQFSNDENDCLIVVQSEKHLFTRQSIRGFDHLVEQIGLIGGVDNVLSMASIRFYEGGLAPRTILPAPDASAEEREQMLLAALNHPLVGDVLLSRDGRTALVIVRLADNQRQAKSIQNVLLKVGSVSEQASKIGGFTCTLTGVPVIRVAVLKSIEHDQAILTLAATVVGAFVAFLFFRTVSATLLVAAGPLIGLFWTVGILGFLGIEINPISAVLPTLILVIGFADSVHLVLEMRRQQARGIDRHEAALLTIRLLALPCGLTSLTTAVGFASLCIVDIPSIRNFGLVTAIGAVTTFFAVLTVVPFLGTTPIGQRLTRGRMQVAPNRKLHWAKLANVIVRFPRRIAITGILATLALGWSAYFLRPDSKLTDTLPSGFASYRGIQICDHEFGGATEAQILVEWDESRMTNDSDVLQSIAAAQEIIAQSPEFGRSLSILDVLAVTPGNQAAVHKSAMLPFLHGEAIHRFWRPDLRRSLIRVRVPDRFASELRPEFDKIESELAGLEASHPGFRFWVTGPVVVIGKNIRDMITELIKSLAVAAGIIFVILTISFRSLRLGLISLVPNTFPMVMTAAVIVGSGTPLLIGNVIVFSVCLGIAVDDTIHFMAANQRLIGRGRSPAEAVTGSFETVGTALVITTTVLVLGFSTTVLSQLDMIRMFGLLSCVAIVSALLGDLVILPSLLLWSGRESGSLTTLNQQGGDHLGEQSASTGG